MSALRRLGPLLAVTLLATAFRIYQLDHIPPGLFGDEAADGVEAAAIRAGERWPVYIEEPEATKWGSREPMYHYLMAAVFAATGPSVFALRLTSALIGAATVSLYYVLAARLFGARVGLAASAMLAVGHWHVIASRVGIRGVLGPFWLVLTLLAFERLVRRRSLAAALALGATIGAGFYTYPSYWIVPPALIVVSAALVWRPGGSMRPSVRLLAGVAIAALIVAAPLIHYAATRPDYYFARAARSAVVADRDDSLRDNLQRVLFMLHLRGDTNARQDLPGAPLLDPISGALFLIGLLASARAWVWAPPRPGGARAREIGLLAFWLLPLLPSAVSDSAPHALRALGSAPAVCLIAARGLDVLARHAARIAGEWLATASTCVVLLAIAGFGYRTVFVHWSASPAVAAAFNADAVRFFALCADLAAENDLYASAAVRDAPQARFLRLQRPTLWHPLEDARAFVAEAAVRDRIYVADTPALRDAVAALYPGAEVIARFALEGSSGGRVLRVRAADLRPSLTQREAAAVRRAVGR